MFHQKSPRYHQISKEFLTREIKSENFRFIIIMEVILLKNILKLGNIGDKVKVKNGYGRKFSFKEVKL